MQCIQVKQDETFWLDQSGAAVQARARSGAVRTRLIFQKYCFLFATISLRDYYSAVTLQYFSAPKCLGVHAPELRRQNVLDHI